MPQSGFTEIGEVSGLFLESQPRPDRPAAWDNVHQTDLHPPGMMDIHG